MARQGWRQGLSRLALVAALAVSAAIGVSAQQPPATPPATETEQKPESELPPLSRECQVGSAEIVMPSPLPNVERAMRERQRIVILAVGSSPSFRREANPGGYYDLVEKLLEQTFKGLEVSIVHRGVPGELVRDAAERIKMEVALVNPDLVFWQVGTADAMARSPVDTFEENLNESLVWLRGHGVDVALIGLHYIKALTKDEHYQAIRASLKRVASAQGIMRISRYEAGEILTRLHKEQGRTMSGARLKDAAYECSAEYLARAVASGLFARTKGAKTPLPKK